MDPLSALADIATGNGAGGRPTVDAHMSELSEELDPDNDSSSSAAQSGSKRGRTSDEGMCDLFGILLASY